MPFLGLDWNLNLVWQFHFPHHKLIYHSYLHIREWKELIFGLLHPEANYNIKQNKRKKFDRNAGLLSFSSETDSIITFSNVAWPLDPWKVKCFVLVLCSCPSVHDNSQLALITDDKTSFRLHFCQFSLIWR